MKKETIYLKAEQNIEVTHPDVSLGDVVQIECSDPTVVPKLKAMKLLKFQNGKKRRCVISILKIIECIHKQYPMLEIQNVGEPDLIITFENQKTSSAFVHWMKVIAVVAITFTGAAFSIMTFNNDVDTTKLFGQIYELLMGNPSDGFTVLEFMYSIGMIVGILIFFNHFGGKKFSVDPTPMEVEMRLYENDIQTTLIENYSRKGQEIDVGKTVSAGTHRT